MTTDPKASEHTDEQAPPVLYYDDPESGFDDAVFGDDAEEPAPIERPAGFLCDDPHSLCDDPNSVLGE